jgi:hypothetical protein
MKSSEQKIAVAQLSAFNVLIKAQLQHIADQNSGDVQVSGSISKALWILPFQHHPHKDVKLVEQ